MTNQELAKMTLEFMKRVDLKGEEVPAYVAVNNWLQDMAAEEVPDEQAA